MTNFGGVSGEYLRQYIDRIERLEEEKSGLASDIRDVFAEAKANGFVAKTMRQILRLRKLEKAKREEEEALLETYKHALGMQMSFDFEEPKGVKVSVVTREPRQTHLEEYTGTPVQPH